MERYGFKKGNVVLDSVLFLIVIVVFGIIGVLAAITFDEMSDDISADPDINEFAKNETTELNDRFPSTMDGAFALLFGLLWLAVLVTSFMVDSHPIFFIASIVLLIILLIGAGYLGNAYEEFSSDAEYSTMAAEFPITSYILSNLLLVVLVIGGTIALALFGKNRIG